MPDPAAVLIHLEPGKPPVRLVWTFRARYRLTKLPDSSYIDKFRRGADADPLEIMAELIWAMMPNAPHERTAWRWPEDVAEAYGKLDDASRASIDTAINRAIADASPPAADQEGRGAPGESTGTSSAPSPASSSA